MNLLIVNDDGIFAPGICRLAGIARSLGTVWVIAPATQCSGMAGHITAHGDLLLREEKEFPCEGVSAWSLTGTPADCVRVGLDALPVRPDVVLSGINRGYNIGLDIVCSGTVGAAMQARMQGIPAIACSSASQTDYRLEEKFLLPLLKELLAREISESEIWNVNFPLLREGEVPGICEDCAPSRHHFYAQCFEKMENKDGTATFRAMTVPVQRAETGSDAEAILRGCITVQRIGNAVLKAAAGRKPAV